MTIDTYVTPRRTPVDHEVLRVSIATAWRELRKEAPSSDCVSVLLAQSAFETNHWQQCFNFNLGGVKSSARGLHTYHTTTEVLPRARGLEDVARSTPGAPCELAADRGGDTVTVRYFPRHPTCRFRAWPSLDDSARAFTSLFLHEFEEAGVSAEAGDVTGFVAALKEGGYFTGELVTYERAVAALYDGYRAPCLATRWEVVQALSALHRWPADEYTHAVRRFQREHGCGVDGIVGPETRKALRTALTAIGRAPP